MAPKKAVKAASAKVQKAVKAASAKVQKDTPAVPKKPEKKQSKTKMTLLENIVSIIENGEELTMTLPALKKALEQARDMNFTQTAAKNRLKKALDEGLEGGLLTKEGTSYGPGAAGLATKEAGYRQDFIKKVQNLEEAWYVDFGESKMELGPLWFSDSKEAYKYRRMVADSHGHDLSSVEVKKITPKKHDGTLDLIVAANGHPSMGIGVALQWHANNPDAPSLEPFNITTKSSQTLIDACIEMGIDTNGVTESAVASCAMQFTIGYFETAAEAFEAFEMRVV